MGCDGGTIPRRDELVRVKKKPEKVDKNVANAAKWKHCAISQQPLRQPIVSCELGKLYNKEAVIEHLLAKGSNTEVASHIRNLSDVKALNLTLNNGFEKKQADKGDQYVDAYTSRFVCPVTGIEMSGKQKFYFPWKCGCVFSEKAIKEVKSNTCHKCGIPMQVCDLIVLNGSDEEVETLKVKMEERRSKAKLEKKRKKAVQSSTVTDEKKLKVDMNAPSTSKSDEPSNDKVEKTKKIVSVNGNTNGISAKNLILPKKAQAEYSIAKDPTATDAFKSLFTSHENAKNQTKAHWITHNPLYF